MYRKGIFRSVVTKFFFYPFFLSFFSFPFIRIPVSTKSCIRRKSAYKKREEKNKKRNKKKNKMYHCIWVISSFTRSRRYFSLLFFFYYNLLSPPSNFPQHKQNLPALLAKRETNPDFPRPRVLLTYFKPCFSSHLVSRTTYSLFIPDSERNYALFFLSWICREKGQSSRI